MNFLKTCIVEIDRFFFSGRFRKYYAEQAYKKNDKKHLKGVLSEKYPYGLSIEYDKTDKSLLNSLCDKYGSDKGEIAPTNNPYPWPSHSYADCYELIFQLRRNDVNVVVECGIGTDDPNISATMGVNAKPGASLRVWRDYFPSAQVIGLDIDARILFEEERIKTFQCDQTSKQSIEKFIVDSQLKDTSVDVVIDDGLHLFHAGISLFENLNKCLSENGVYIIEDVSEQDYLLYIDYFAQIKSDYMARFVDLHRPNLPVGNNRMLIITKLALAVSG